LRINVRHYGYPPDLEATATQTVLKQAELLCGEMALHATVQRIDFL